MWFRSKPDPAVDDDDGPEILDPVSYDLETVDPENVEQPRLLITALGASGDALEASITSACSIARLDGRTPIVVCSDLPVRFLVAAEVPVEMLPRAKDLALLNRFEFEQYLTRRWEIVRGKWQISEVINLAEGFETFLGHQLSEIAEAAR